MLEVGGTQGRQTKVSTESEWKHVFEVYFSCLALNRGLAKDLGFCL